MVKLCTWCNLASVGKDELARRALIEGNSTFTSTSTISQTLISTLAKVLALFEVLILAQISASGLLKI